MTKNIQNPHIGSKTVAPSLVSPASPQSLSRIAVKSGERILFIDIDEIDWIEAADNYLKLHVGMESYQLRGRLRELEKQLAPDQFARIHRSAMVNLDRLKELRPFNGQRSVILKNGTQLKASSSYMHRLRDYSEPTL